MFCPKEHKIGKRKLQIGPKDMKYLLILLKKKKVVGEKNRRMN